jgi:hypothetical protein
MTKRWTLVALALSVSCIGAMAGDYKPVFVLDYKGCGDGPVISGNSVTFGAGDTCGAGRVVSKNRYTNITRITATIDLSRLNQNWVNASFYSVENRKFPDKQPIGKDDYCDAGGAHNDWNCREIDFMETNGNKIFQTTLHLGDGGQRAPQRYEYSFANTADSSCFDYINMNGNPLVGLHSLTNPAYSIDMSKPFEIITEFTYGAEPKMTTVFKQANNPVTYTVYDTTDGPGAEGSYLEKFDDLITSMKNGQWILVSFWQGNWVPQGPGNKWWSGKCSWGDLCNTKGLYWGISNIVVTAESEL